MLDTEFPNWRTLSIHESSPSGGASEAIKAACPGYSCSFFYPGVQLGSLRDGSRCEDLEHLTFADSTFDVFITQDVLEHLFDPGAAIREIHRVLKPGGAHIFTVPMYRRPKTEERARRVNGTIEHLLPPDYHGDPINADGVLVVNEWGEDIIEFIAQHASRPEVVNLRVRVLGIDGEFMEVFIARR